MIFDKLLDIQKELKVPKNQYNKFGNFKYRSVEDIYETAKPVLKKHNVVLTLSDDIIPIAFNDKVVPFVKTTASICDPEDGTHHEVTATAGVDLDKKGMDYSQATGAASSYARKYALNGLFLLDDSKDADSLDAKIAEAKPDAVMIKSLRDKTNGDKKFEEYIVSVKLNGGDRKSFDDLNIGQVEYLIRNWEKLLVGTPYEEKK
jgi:hypothetical protein